MTDSAFPGSLDTFETPSDDAAATSYGAAAETAQWNAGKVNLLQTAVANIEAALGVGLSNTVPSPGYGVSALRQTWQVSGLPMPTLPHAGSIALGDGPVTFYGGGYAVSSSKLWINSGFVTGPINSTGVSTSGSALPYLLEFDLSAGTWVTAFDTPAITAFPNGYAGDGGWCVVIGSYVYVGGGDNAPGDPSNAALRFDTIGHTWTTLSNNPISFDFGIYGAADGKVFTGALSGSTMQLSVYTPGGAWSRYADVDLSGLSPQVSGNPGFQVGRKLIFAGANLWLDLDATYGPGAWHRIASSGTAGVDYPDPAQGAPVAINGTTIHALGAADTGNHFVLNTGTMAWSVATPDLPSTNGYVPLGMRGSSTFITAGISFVRIVSGPITGPVSFAAEFIQEGTNSLGLAANAHAEGLGTVSTGPSAHSEGHNTTAAGPSSHAEGDGTFAAGSYSHAEGSNSTASGNQSHAEGSFGNASGGDSHAEGTASVASGDSSHAENTNTVASGDAAHAEGLMSVASGHGSHAEGNSALASGDYSHAEGAGQALGEHSHAEGGSTFARGDYSHSGGVNGDARNAAAYAFGGPAGQFYRVQLFSTGAPGSLAVLVDYTSPGNPVKFPPAQGTTDVKVRIMAVPMDRTTGLYRVWDLRCLIDGATGGFLGTPAVTNVASSGGGAAAWTVTPSVTQDADGTYLHLTVGGFTTTGGASDVILVSALVEALEEWN